MAELLALSAAGIFGLVHFCSGLLARRSDSFAVALFGQLGGMGLVTVIAALVGADRVTIAPLAWGALSGIGTGVGVSFLYRGLSRGRMSLVVPLSDVGAVALPVLVGVVVLGDRPGVLAWCGVVAAVPALWLVSRQAGSTGGVAVSGTTDGLVAGAGFALQFIAISRADSDAGLWPILAARVLAAFTILVTARSFSGRLALRRRLVLPALVVGASGSVAIWLYLVATRQQMLALVTVLAALYPVIPVVLALVFLHERITGRQTLGLLLAGFAIAAISLD